MRNNKVRNLAFSSIFAALSVIVCVLGSFFSTMSLTITAITGVISAVAVVQCGYKYAALTYAAASVLVFLFVPNRECAVYYILFFGHFPIVKVFLERIRSKVLRQSLKLVIGNILFALILWILVHLIGIEENIAHKEVLILAGLFNAAFILYDVLLGRIVAIYIGKRLGKNGFR
ncbi:MAG: hypothetical protein E7473_03935 [Ruminococcaceae bacterium]|nr:hypothetical protein [Oscillospiraceae bacterium]